MNIEGLNNYIPIEIMEEPGVGKVLTENEENSYIVFFQPENKPAGFMIDGKEIYFINESDLVGKLKWVKLIMMNF